MSSQNRFRGALAAAMVTVGIGLHLYSAEATVQSGNSRLQRQVDAALAGKAGVAIIIEHRTQRALASREPQGGASFQSAPGSTVKPLLLEGLLAAGLVSKNEKLMCSRQVRIGNARLDCTHPPELKVVTARDALAWSCNSYFASVISRLAPAQVERILAAAGFSGSGGLAADQPQPILRRSTTDHERTLLALGAEGLDASPEHLLSAYQRLAQRLTGEAASDHQTVLLEGLKESVVAGTAIAAFVPEMPAAGKTGTARGRDGRIYGWFAGWAPADKPEIVLVVRLEQGRGADAAAVAGTILRAYAEEAKK